jgi:hypothetical protein
MVFNQLGAFAAGVAVGWAGRSLAGSTREALVRIVVAGHHVKNDLRRAIAERVEWIEDLMAEGRIRYEESVTRAGAVHAANQNADDESWSEGFPSAPQSSAGSGPPSGGRAA